MIKTKVASKYGLVRCCHCGAYIARMYALSVLDKEGHPAYLCDDCQASFQNRGAKNNFKERSYKMDINSITPKMITEMIDAVYKSKEAILKKTLQCIGCGYCCRKAPCGLAYGMFTRFFGTDLSDSNIAILLKKFGGCPFLIWDNTTKKWRCSLYKNAPKILKEEFRCQLAIGRGCCAPLNTYRCCEYVPTAKELEDEDTLLKKLNKNYGKRK